MLLGFVMIRATKLKTMVSTASSPLLLHYRSSDAHIPYKSVTLPRHFSGFPLGERAELKSLSRQSSFAPPSRPQDLFTLRYCFGHMRFSVRAGNAFKSDVSGGRPAQGEEHEEAGQKPVSLVCRRELQALDEMGICTTGEIHVIVGPMFAGKTTALLRRMQAEIHTGRRVVLVKSDKDTRYGLNSVVSHDGVKMPCWAAADLATFKAKLGEEAYRKLDVIGIDEAQFFEDLYSFCQIAADKDGKTVIVAGLDGDYLRKNFGSTLELIPLADSVIKLTSRCELCGKPASFTLRKTGDRKTEVIGGADVYMPVCRQHYVNGQIIVDATRTILEAQQVQCDTQIKAATVSG